MSGMSRTTKRVLVTGTYDVLHLGHIAHFKQARRYGNTLIVVVARDKTVQALKHALPLFNEQERAALIRELRVADVVVLGDTRNPFRAIRRYRPGVICIGYDQRHFVKGLKTFLKEQGMNTRVVVTKALRPTRYKSSHIKQTQH